VDHSVTRKSLDVLGDLFLTGTKPDVPDQDTPEDDRRDMDKPPADSNAAGMLNGPRPVRMPPKPAMQRRAAVSNEPTDDGQTEHTLRLVGVDSSADSAVAGDDAQTSRTPRRQRMTSAAARFEAVFLGNLPGFGGPWLAQYANHLAEQIGRPVAVLHVDEEQIDMDLVGTVSQRDDINAAAELLTRASKDGLVDRLDVLLRELPNLIGAWLVHLPMPMNNLSVQLARDVSRWSLLTGSDEMAVISAYQWIKDLLADYDGPEPHVGVMFMGSDEAESDAATTKLVDTAAKFLETPLTRIGTRKQMAPVHLKQIGCFANEPGTWTHLVALLSDFIEEEITDDVQTPAVATPIDEPIEAPDIEEPQPKSALDDIEHEIPLEDLIGDTRLSRDIEAAEPLTEEETQILIGAGYADEAITDDVDEEVMMDEVADQAVVEDTPAAPVDADEDELADEPDSVRAFVQRLKSNPRTLTSFNSTPPPREVPAEVAPKPPVERPPALDPAAKLTPKIAPNLAEKVVKAPPPPKPQPVAIEPEPEQSDEQVESPPIEVLASADQPIDGDMLAEPDQSQAVAATLASPIVTQSTGLQPQAEPKPVADPVPSTPNVVPSDEESLDLSTFLSGGVAIAARCPNQPGTQLVLDEMGTLHLLAHHTGDQPQTLHESYLALLEARNWVQQHLEILQMTQRQLRFDNEAEPVLHLFTDQAKSAVALLTQIGSASVRLHLLQQVRLGDQSTWFCTELN